MFKKNSKYQYLSILFIIIFIVFFNLFSFNFFIKNYEKLEDEKNLEKINYIISTINTQFDNIQSTVTDYASWDDTYEYMKNENSNYIYNNFREENLVLENLKLDFMLFIDNYNTPVHLISSEAIIKENKEKLKNLILEINKINSSNKIVKLENNYFLIAKSDIIKSDLTGEPTGILYSGTYLDLKELNEIYDNSIKIIDKKDKKSLFEIKNKTFNPILININKTSEILNNFINFTDNNKNNLLTLNFLNPRDLYLKAKNDILLFNIIISILLLIMYFIFLKFLKYQENINTELKKRVEEEINKRKEQEELIIHQSKLASMGEMIGNIAHQWRQPLNTLSLILQNIDFASQSDELNKEFVKKSIDKSNLLINNMSRTIDDFRNFFKPNKAKEIFSVNNSINDCTNMLHASFEHYNITILKKGFEENLEIVNLRNELYQVLLILLSNAKDALISDKIEKPEVLIEIQKENNQIFVNIKDNAKGIKKEIINKIFEPYFTTKQDSNGTGIGLYMAKTIIEKNMNGKLSVKSDEKGSEFIIQLPLN